MIVEGDRPAAKPAAAEFQGRLLPGEVVLWSGRPRPKSLPSFPPVLTLFMLFWCGGVLTGLLQARARGNVFGMGIAIAMLLFGLSFFIPVLREVGARRRTAYAVTDRRLLFLRTGRTGRFVALPLDGDFPTQLKLRGGTGTISFGAIGAEGSMAPTLEDVTEFADIDDAENVLQLVEQARQAARRS